MQVYQVVAASRLFPRQPLDVVKVGVVAVELALAVLTKQRSMVGIDVVNRQRDEQLEDAGVESLVRDLQPRQRDERQKERAGQLPGQVIATLARQQPDQ